MKKTILIFIYSIIFVLGIFPIININNLYLWLMQKPKIIENIKKESFYLISFPREITNKIIDFKIGATYFKYEGETELNYDLFMITNRYSIDKIIELVKNRKESNYYDLMKLLKEDNQNYFNQNDEIIIKSLKTLLNIDFYQKELKEKYKSKLPNIIDRVKKINEKNDYYKIYKQYLIKNLEVLNEK